MSKYREKKEKIAQELAAKIKNTSSLILADYRGLTHHQLANLRKALKKQEAEFPVVKNTILKRVLKEANQDVEGLKGHFEGPTAVLLTHGDPLSPLKEILKFNRLFQLPNLKAGIFEGKVLTGQDLLNLARLPSKEVLLGQLIGQMKAPIYSLHQALDWNMQKLVMTLRLLKQKKFDDRK